MPIPTVDNYNRLVMRLIPGAECYNPADKVRVVNDHIRYMLARTQSMFIWDGLPDTIPARSLELLLQLNGFAGVLPVGDDLYAMYGGLGGEPDPYYRPTILTVANPALNYSANLRINEECCIILGDSLVAGLLPMLSRYATALCENELSIRLATINARTTSLISAPDDRTKEAGEKYLSDLADGKQGVIAENGFLDGIRTQPYASTGYNNTLTALIETEQYLKASMYNELGLNANYNMKRESLNSAESQLNDDALLPLVDDMLSCRQYGAEKINKMFGTSISVRLASAWEDNQIELDAKQDAITEDPEPEPEPDKDPEEGDNADE